MQMNPTIKVSAVKTCCNPFPKKDNAPQWLLMTNWQSLKLI